MPNYGREILGVSCNVTTMIVAEIFAHGSWEPIDIDTALKMPRTRQMRCPECKGRVRAHKEGSNGQQAHVEHSIGHAGCSLGHYFNGRQTPHPKALR